MGIGVELFSSNTNIIVSLHYTHPNIIKDNTKTSKCNEMKGKRMKKSICSTCLVNFIIE